MRSIDNMRLTQNAPFFCERKKEATLMRKQIDIQVPNALIYVLDNEHGEIPESLDTGLLTTTPSCVVIGTIPDCDGSVDIVLTDEPYSNNDRALHLAWSGRINTLDKEISVSSVYVDQLMSIKVNNSNLLVQIWVNHHEFPDRLIIVVDSCKEMG